MFYPVFLNLRGRRVLVVGGGPVAERKIEALLEAGALVTLVSPEATPHLDDLAARGAITVSRRVFSESDMDGAVLAISATNDPAVQKRVAAAAAARNILVNTVDRPDLCDFIMPAVVRRGDVVVAISTSGASPALARALRSKIEGVVTEEVARTARILKAVRPEVQSRFADEDQRRRFFETVLDSGIIEWISACDDDAAARRVRRMMDESQ